MHLIKQLGTIQVEKPWKFSVWSSIGLKMKFMPPNTCSNQLAYVICACTLSGSICNLPSPPWWRITCQVKSCPSTLEGRCQYIQRNIRNQTLRKNLMRYKSEHVTHRLVFTAWILVISSGCLQCTNRSKHNDSLSGVRNSEKEADPHLCILRDPWATSWDDTIFSGDTIFLGESLLQESWFAWKYLNVLTSCPWVSEDDTYVTQYCTWLLRYIIMLTYDYY